eukprot:SM000022S07203  [mRNA]  locus=s22:504694:512564:+ [translate_table: standard]
MSASGNPRDDGGEPESGGKAKERMLAAARRSAHGCAAEPQASEAGTQAAMEAGARAVTADVGADLGEVYFLVMHFLAGGPCTAAARQLQDELLQHKLLPRRYHAHYERQGPPAEASDGNVMSFPLVYSEVKERYKHVGHDHLLRILDQHVLRTSSLSQGQEGALDVLSAADKPTLLGGGGFSLLDEERASREVPYLVRQMRWPQWRADPIRALTLREAGGGFRGRPNSLPSSRLSSYVLAKPSVLINRIDMIKKLRGHVNAVYCAIFDRTGQLVITGSDDRLVKIWSMETALCLTSCRGHEGDITDLAVNSDNKLVASSSNDWTVRVWRLPDGGPIAVLGTGQSSPECWGHTLAVTAIAFSPRTSCATQLLSASDDGTCLLWKATDATLPPRVYKPSSPSPEPLSGRTAQVAGLRNVVDPHGQSQSPQQILCCAFNSDGSIFVTGSNDHVARVWDANSRSATSQSINTEIAILRGHEKEVNYVQFSGCASRHAVALSSSESHCSSRTAADNIVTCSRDGTAIIWMPRARPKHHHKGRAWVKAYHLKVPLPSPAKTGGSRAKLQAIPCGVNVMTWSLDNRFVMAAIMDCRICVWNAADGSLVHSLSGHDKQTYVLDVHPFNPRIAMSAGYDGKIIVWDIWEGQAVRVYTTACGSSEPYSLVDAHFSPDGTSMVVSDEVGQIYLFSTGAGKSQQEAQYDQFFLGDYGLLLRDGHGNVLDQETELPPHERNVRDLLCDAGMIPYPEPIQSNFQRRRLSLLGRRWSPGVSARARAAAVSSRRVAAELGDYLPDHDDRTRSGEDTIRGRVRSSGRGTSNVAYIDVAEEDEERGGEGDSEEEEGGSNYTASRDAELSDSESGSDTSTSESELDTEATTRTLRSAAQPKEARATHVRKKRDAVSIGVCFSQRGRRLKRRETEVESDADGSDFEAETQKRKREREKRDRKRERRRKDRASARAASLSECSAEPASQQGGAREAAAAECAEPSGALESWVPRGERSARVHDAGTEPAYSAQFALPLGWDGGRRPRTQRPRQLRIILRGARLPRSADGCSQSPALPGD